MFYRDPSGIKFYNILFSHSTVISSHGIFLFSYSHGHLMRFFKIKSAYEMITVQQRLFSTHERIFLLKCRSFRDRKCLNWKGTRTPNLRIHAEWSNHVSYQGQTFDIRCFYTGSVGLLITTILHIHSAVWCAYCTCAYGAHFIMSWWCLYGVANGRETLHVIIYIQITSGWIYTQRDINIQAKLFCS